MESFIQQKNYFNSINGFETLFLLTSNPKKYMSRVSFKDIKRIYVLDRNIAKYLFQEIEKIEIELKSRIAYEFAREHCSSGIESNLNYLDINFYERPTRHNQNSFTDYFYTSGKDRKTHIFSELIIFLLELRMQDLRVMYNGQVLIMEQYFII